MPCYGGGAGGGTGASAVAVGEALAALPRKSGERLREYQGWLTADVPFGCARFEVGEAQGDGPLRTIFTATAARSDKGAKAELDKSKAR